VGAIINTTPVSAQSLGPSFSIEGNRPYSRGSNDQAAPRPGYRRPDFGSRCMSDQAIRSGLQNYGFRDINLTSGSSRTRVKLRALYDDNWYYSMAVNRCTGLVSHVSPLYSAGRNDNGGYRNGRGSDGYYGGRGYDNGGSGGYDQGGYGY
jgi:hypothetical protein